MNRPSPLAVSALTAALLCAPFVAACVSTASGPRFTRDGAAFAEGAAKVLCELEEEIPDVGAEVERTCGIQVAAFDKWVDSMTADGVPQTARVTLRRKRRAADAGAEGGGR